MWGAWSGGCDVAFPPSKAQGRSAQNARAIRERRRVLRPERARQVRPGQSERFASAALGMWRQMSWHAESVRQATILAAHSDARDSSFLPHAFSVPNLRRRLPRAALT